MAPTLARFSALFVALVFTWAAAAKVAERDRWRVALEGYGLGSLRSALLYGVPLLELGVAFVLLWGNVKAGAALTLALLAAFSSATVRARALKGDRLPCGCFGQEGAKDFKVILARNALLTVPVWVVLSSDLEGGALSGMAFPHLAELLPALIALSGVCAFLWVGVHTRQLLKRK